MNLKPVKVSSKWTPLASQMVRAMPVVTMELSAPGLAGMVPVLFLAWMM